MASCYSVLIKLFLKVYFDRTFSKSSLQSRRSSDYHHPNLLVIFLVFFRVHQDLSYKKGIGTDLPAHGNGIELYKFKYVIRRLKIRLLRSKITQFHAFKRIAMVNYAARISLKKPIPCQI